MTTNEYAFDLRLDVALRVHAASLEDARAILKRKLDCASANFGAFDDGKPILGEASLNGEVPAEALFEINGEEAVICPGCGVVEGEKEWGTVGDGFDGYCPSCADQREAAGEHEHG